MARRALVILVAVVLVLVVVASRIQLNYYASPRARPSRWGRWSRCRRPGPTRSHGSDPPHRRLPHTGEPARLPTRQADGDTQIVSPQRDPRPLHPAGPADGPGLPGDGPGPVGGQGGRADAGSATGAPSTTPARWSSRGARHARPTVAGGGPDRTPWTARPTPDVCAFVERPRPLRAGATRPTLSVEQSTVTPNAVIEPGRVVGETVRLARRRPRPGQAADGGARGYRPVSRGYLGVAVETQQDFTYPSRCRSTPGHRRAVGRAGHDPGDHRQALRRPHHGGPRRWRPPAPSTPTGNVGRRRRGAPRRRWPWSGPGPPCSSSRPQEYATAKSKAIPSLHVYTVSTLDQALAVLAASVATCRRPTAEAVGRRPPGEPPRPRTGPPGTHPAVPRS